MPVIKVQSSVPTPDTAVVKDLLKNLSSKLSSHLGKPESYIMTAFEPVQIMTFAGTDEPVCYIEIKSIGKMAPAVTKAMSQDFCQCVKEKLEVPENRTYIEFADSERHMWGWNNTTF